MIIDRRLCARVSVAGAKMLFHTGPWGDQEEPMQIRLTVLVPQSGDAAPQSCDLMVTAPTGTVLASIVGALTSAAAGAVAGEAGGGGGGDRGDGGGETASALFAGTERLDPQRQLVGEPPLVDGAVLSLHTPSAPPALDAYGSARARLHVVSGPDSGGVHLLHGGRVQLGRSADADVVLDDPDVSRLHCAVTVLDGGEVTVTDLGSTNGTSVDGRSVDDRPTLLGPEASLQLGESALRLVASPRPAAPPERATVPDGEGRLQLGGEGDGPELRHVTGAAGPWGQGAAIPAQGAAGGTARGATEPVAAGRTDALVPNQSRAFEGSPDETRTETVPTGRLPFAPTVSGTGATVEPAAGGTPRRRSRGIGAWARRLASGGADPEPERAQPGGAGPAGTAAMDHDRWPDPATVLLTALGPGHRLWDREPGHPDTLSVRIGTTHHTDRRGDPLIVDLTTAGGLGLAGPRPRLASLARSLLAQLAVLHAPDVLEIVLIAADPARDAAARVEEWSWLGWLPHLRPRNGQDCRLLTAFDPAQAAARAAELARRPVQSAGTAQDGPPPAVPVTVLVVDGDPGTSALRDAVVVLDDPDVSRLHCAVTVLDGGVVTVTDLGSSNGTSVDGRSWLNFTVLILAVGFFVVLLIWELMP
jgi:pSer/pThr/pTyr-binding forkhead associated (FHA) protein